MDFHEVHQQSFTEMEEKKEQPVTRINGGKCQSNRSKFQPRILRKSCKCEVALKFWEQMTKNFPLKRLQRNNQGGMQNQTCKRKARDDENEASWERKDITEREEWTLMSLPLVIDSGAAETVSSTDWFTGHELNETEESRGKQFCVCAGGREIPNYGEGTITLSTLDWSFVRNMSVPGDGRHESPLISLRELHTQTNSFSMIQEASLKTKRSRERLCLYALYVWDVYVTPPDCHKKKNDFHRRGIR